MSKKLSKKQAKHDLINLINNSKGFKLNKKKKELVKKAVEEIIKNEEKE